MKITVAQIKQGTHFQMRKSDWAPHYWRHLVKDWDEQGRKVAIDFVQSRRGKRGMRVNIRLLLPNSNLWKPNGWPVKWDWKTAECWVRPDGTVEDIDENKANTKQKQDAASEDWRPFMEALLAKLAPEVV